MPAFTIDKKSNKTVHQQLVAGLKHHAMGLKDGSRMASETTLCRDYSLARMTVSKALNELVQENILVRIKGKGTFVQRVEYKVESIKFLLPGPECLSANNYNSKIIQKYLSGVLEEAHKTNIRVETVICTSDHKYSSLKPEQFRSFNKNDNVFILSEWWESVFSDLLASGCNMVYNDQYMNPVIGESFSDCYLLKNNVVEAVSDIVSYFVESGREKIFCFNMSETDRRTIGYLKGLEKNKIKFNADLMPLVEEKAYQKPDDVIDLIVDTYKKCPFNAVVLPDNSFHDIFDAAMERLELNCPDDIALVSIRDCEENNKRSIPISAMAISYAELGAAAVKAFNRGFFAPGEKMFTPVLVERESSRKGAGAKTNPNFKENINHSNDDFLIS